MSDKLLKPAEVAAQLGVHPETVKRWLRDGTLEGQRVGAGKRWRIPESAIERHLNGGKR